MLHGIALTDFIAYFGLDWIGLDCRSRYVLCLLVSAVISDVCYTHTVYICFCFAEIGDLGVLYLVVACKWLVCSIHSDHQ